MVYTEPLSLAPPPLPLLPQTLAGTSMKKRKGKAPTPNQTYKIKCQLSDKEAKKITLSMGAPPMPIPSLLLEPSARKASIIVHGITLKKDLGRSNSGWKPRTRR
ncbi:hypothetical protein BDZ91DRAFT_803207 [Kalaharituber pfeilii]|nr:hypothetical protein BDZ91DRAFT_803207 [Kalaharituber pfeilii]